MQRRRFLTTVLAAPALMAAPAMASDAARIRELYTKAGEMSEFAQSNAGRRITFQGFMAPPLKAQSKFFVLTKLPMSVCPFCETEAEWPSDILAVYTKRVVDVIPFNVKIEARGVLEMGSLKDPETGFVSLVRLADASYERA